jgi:hypothetical protein
MVKYIALIWTKWDSDADVGMMEMDKYEEFNQAAAEAGVLQGGSALQPASAATTVRLRDDEVLMTDGPFAESKEQLSGYYILECDHLDDVLGWVARIPGARHGAVEVRPLLPGP